MRHEHDYFQVMDADHRRTVQRLTRIPEPVPTWMWGCIAAGVIGLMAIAVWAVRT